MYTCDLYRVLFRFLFKARTRIYLSFGEDLHVGNKRGKLSSRTEFINIFMTSKLKLFRIYYQTSGQRSQYKTIPNSIYVFMQDEEKLRSARTI